MTTNVTMSSRNPKVNYSKGYKDPNGNWKPYPYLDSLNRVIRMNPLQRTVVANMLASPYYFKTKRQNGDLSLKPNHKRWLMGRKNFASFFTFDSKDTPYYSGEVSEIILKK